ncbi:MAG TPA: DUF2141 domain-containing protein [Bacteroides sp.]|nr:DUF2141 domain-containing protein [Bacteroides sp.]
MKCFAALILFLFPGAGSLLCGQSPLTGTLEIRFTGIRSDRGQIAVGMNRSPEGWPREPHMDFFWEKDGLDNGVLVAEIENLPYGVYAISVLDDVNRNGEMEMVLGIPREGWGFSNNPANRLSPPDFNKCAFLIEQPFVRITIELHYAAGGR